MPLHRWQCFGQEPKSGFQIKTTKLLFWSSRIHCYIFGKCYNLTLLASYRKSELWCNICSGNLWIFIITRWQWLSDRWLKWDFWCHISHNTVPGRTMNHQPLSSTVVYIVRWKLLGVLIHATLGRMPHTYGIMIYEICQYDMICQCDTHCQWSTCGHQEEEKSTHSCRKKTLELLYIFVYDYEISTVYRFQPSYYRRWDCCSHCYSWLLYSHSHPLSIKCLYFIVLKCGREMGARP